MICAADSWSRNTTAFGWVRSIVAGHRGGDGFFYRSLDDLSFSRTWNGEDEIRDPKQAGHGQRDGPRRNFGNAVKSTLIHLLLPARWVGRNHLDFLRISEISRSRIVKRQVTFSLFREGRAGADEHAANPRISGTHGAGLHRSFRSHRSVETKHGAVSSPSNNAGRRRNGALKGRRTHPCGIPPLGSTEAGSLPSAREASRARILRLRRSRARFHAPPRGREYGRPLCERLPHPSRCGSRRRGSAVLQTEKF